VWATGKKDTRGYVANMEEEKRVRSLPLKKFYQRRSRFVYTHPRCSKECMERMAGRGTFSPGGLKGRREGGGREKEADGKALTADLN